MIRWHLIGADSLLFLPWLSRWFSLFSVYAGDREDAAVCTLQCAPYSVHLTVCTLTVPLSLPTWLPKINNRYWLAINYQPLSAIIGQWKRRNQIATGSLQGEAHFANLSGE